MTTTPQKAIATLVSPDGHIKILFFQGALVRPHTGQGPHITYKRLDSVAGRPGQFYVRGTWADCVGNVRYMWRSLVKDGWVRV